MKRILLIFGMVLLAMAGIRAQQRVKIHTTMGDIVVKLYDETPIHRDNFLKLVREGYYNGTLMHRVIRGFMIQGGDPNSKGAAPDKMLGGGSPDSARCMPPTAAHRIWTVNIRCSARL